MSDASGRLALLRATISTVANGGLRALTYRNKDMETLVTKAVSGGRDGVIHMEPI